MIKLGKLLRSKEDQHEHKLRCIVQSRDKYREQLAKLMEFREMKSERKVRMDLDEGRLSGYEKTILRLEENNSAMIQEIGRLREALTLCSLEAAVRVDQAFEPI